MANEVTNPILTPPVFAGFPDFQANVTFVPIQFFTVVLPHSSRGCARIVGYALRKLLGWVDAQGNPTQEQVRFTYRQLIEEANVSREAIAESLKEALDRRFLRCVQEPQPDHLGQPGRSGVYELCWAEEGALTHTPDEFRGFYFPEAALVPMNEGASVVHRPKAARKNIPNAFFDFLLPRERLSVVRVVGALLFYSIQWGPGGERKVPVSLSITELSRLTRFSRQHVHEAVSEAVRRGYVQALDRGYFDTEAGQESRAATYAIRWATSIAAVQSVTPLVAPPVRKGERAEADRSEKVDEGPVRKREPDRSEKVNGVRSEKVNGISIKTELKTQQATAAAAAEAAVADAIAVAVELLKDVGFDEACARRLADKRPLEIIRQQLEWLSLRNTSRNKLGLLRRAIEQDWPKPDARRPPEPPAPPHAQLARTFATHYYAGYHGLNGEPVDTVFPKDVEVAAKLVARLLRLKSDEALVPEWGRYFGRMMRDKHHQHTQARPDLQFAVVLHGAEFLRGLQKEAAVRQRELLGKAREIHEARFRPMYRKYLRETEAAMQHERAALYAVFSEQRRQDRHTLASGALLATASMLARFDSGDYRLGAFAEFFRQHAECRVLTFWDWDAQLNPQRFGSSSNPTLAQEAHA